MVDRSAPKLAIMCGIATLTTVASMTDKNVPQHHTAISHLKPRFRQHSGVEKRGK